MKKIAFLSLLIVGLSFLSIPLGCKKEQPSPTPQVTPAPTVASVITQTPTLPTVRPTPGETSAPSPTAVPPQLPVEVPLTLTVDSPAAESIVKNKTILIRGKTSPDAVLTVGNSNVDVDENGNFSTSVTLVEGVNVIEVLASDLAGNTRGQVLTAIYSP